MEVLKQVQRLPVTPTPFKDIADKLNVSEDDVLKASEDMLARGIIRRFGPSISHRKLGYGSNPMTVLKVPEERLDEIGEFIASQEGVTHCYHRSGWDYNLFFMIHGKDRESAFERAHEIISKVNIKDYKLLLSIREFKKTSFEI
ncbi:MAG: Lrp/AsnC family transcriptional regulator [Thermoplasmata archaeon]|nr:Lrp/AsnC family transcriptional regulator [Thermoplasmata archaeon]